MGWGGVMKGEGGGVETVREKNYELRMETAVGTKENLKRFFFARGTSNLRPEGSNLNCRWRGWVRSVIILPAFLRTAV